MEATYCDGGNGAYTGKRVQQDEGRSLFRPTTTAAALVVLGAGIERIVDDPSQAKKKRGRGGS
eukprot:CAMPEP_0171994954 /NCGR_PEP_ID=MMETSP0993-20121228/279223_1 /TAXON_ID=483369 /ORGANISM="non described non described, Strain CCMP2098" /LENGTH=62 /DNA_ID=CAMNT_0012648047 /DNA_START=749 /DNA_END=938 /DNA_ORIENTATION=+